MEKVKHIIKGSAVVYNHDDISTDQIFPGAYVNETDPELMANYALIGADKTIKDRIRAGGNILLVGQNFGCGSSREQAVLSLKTCGTEVVIAKSAGRIWYRNAINLALPVIICEQAVDEIQEGDKVTVDLTAGKVINESAGKEYQGEPLSDFVMNIYHHGGVMPMMQEKLKHQAHEK